MARKTQKRMRKDRRRTLRKLSKKKKGGSIDYKKVKDDLMKNQTFEGAKQTLEILKGLPDSGPSYGIGAVRGTMNMLINENVSEQDFDQHVKDILEDLEIILDELIALPVTGGSNSQALIPPTSAFKTNTPVNSDNAWYKIA